MTRSKKGPTMWLYRSRKTPLHWLTSMVTMLTLLKQILIKKWTRMTLIIVRRLRPQILVGKMEVGMMSHLMTISPWSRTSLTGLSQIVDLTRLLPTRLQPLLLRMLVRRIWRKPKYNETKIEILTKSTTLSMNSRISAKTRKGKKPKSLLSVINDVWFVKSDMEEEEEGFHLFT